MNFFCYFPVVSIIFMGMLQLFPEVDGFRLENFLNGILGKYLHRIDVRGMKKKKTSLYLAYFDFHRRHNFCGNF